MENKIFHMTFHCNYEGNHKTIHNQSLPLKDIPRWIDSYKFTHPHCESISVKVWFNDLNEE